MPDYSLSDCVCPRLKVNCSNQVRGRQRGSTSISKCGASRPSCGGILEGSRQIASRVVRAVDSGGTLVQRLACRGLAMLKSLPPAFLLDDAYGFPPGYSVTRVSELGRQRAVRNWGEHF